MAVISLNDTRSRIDYFRQGILTNLQYWQSWLPGKITDVEALDGERDRIIRAIVFALDLGSAAWPAVYELILAFSPYIERRGYWDNWNTILNQAVKLALQAADLDKYTNLTGIVARLLYRQSRFKESTSAYRQVIRLSRQLGNRFDEARACTNLGYYYIEHGYCRRTEVLCCHALDIFEQIGSNHGRAHTENHLGILYTYQGHWDKAQQHLERACAIWQAMGDNHGLMYGYINLGLLYIETESPNQALHYLEKAEKQTTLTGDEVYLGKIYLNMGVAYRTNGEPVQAETYARKAEKIFRRFLNLEELAKVWQNLGLACLDQGKEEEAYQYLEQSLATRRKWNYQYDEIKSLLSFVEYELARGNRKQAITRLNEVEGLMNRTGYAYSYYGLKKLLVKYRDMIP